MSLARASTWLGDSANTSVPSCARSFPLQRAIALSPNGHAASAADGNSAAATRAAAALFLVVFSWGRVRHVREDLRLIWELRLRLITAAAVAALGSHPHGLALLRLRRSDDLDVDLARAVV